MTEQGGSANADGDAAAAAAQHAEDETPPLSTVLPQLDAKQKRISKMQQRRRRNRSSVGEAGSDAALSMSEGGDLTSLAYSASTTSGGGETGKASENAGQTTGESIVRETAEDAATSAKIDRAASGGALSAVSAGASSADDLIISPTPSYEEGTGKVAVDAPITADTATSQVAGADPTKSPGSKSPSFLGLPPASPPLAKPNASTGSNSPTKSPYSSPNRARQHASPNQRHRSQQHQSPGRGGTSPNLTPTTPGLSPLQGQQISPGLSPAAFSPAGTSSPGGSPRQQQSRRHSGQQPPRIPTIGKNHRQLLQQQQQQPPLVHYQSSPTYSDAEGTHTSVGGNSNYSFRPRFESSDSFVVRRQTSGGGGGGGSVIVDTSGADSDYHLPTPQNQYYGGLPPQPAAPLRRRLGTDEIIGNAPPVHDFFGSYRDISPTTGTIRQDQGPVSQQQQPPQQTHSFFGSGGGGGAGLTSSTTPTSNQGSNHGSNATSDTSPSGVYFGDSADETGSHAGGSIVFTNRFGPAGAAGPSSRQRLGSRDGGMQQQSQYQQQHGRAPSWGANSIQESLVKVDSQKNMQPYYHPHSPRTGAADPYPSPSGSLANDGSTPIGALPYHQRRKLMQKRREEEERFAYQQQEPEENQRRAQNTAAGAPSRQRQHLPYRQSSSQQKGRGQRPPTPTNNDQLNLPRRGRHASSSSFDSFDVDSSPDQQQQRGGAQPPRHPQLQKAPSNRRRSPSAGDVGGPPPHPHPNHGRAPSHIRAESSGSISSLGSAGPGSLHADQLKVMTDQLGRDIKGFLQAKKQGQYHQQQQPPKEKGKGFFAGIFGAGQSDPPVNMSVEDYHRRNQAFLQTTAPQRELLAQRRRDPSPQPR